MCVREREREGEFVCVLNDKKTTVRGKISWGGKNKIGFLMFV